MLISSSDEESCIKEKRKGKGKGKGKGEKPGRTSATTKVNTVRDEKWPTNKIPSTVEGTDFHLVG